MPETSTDRIDFAHMGVTLGAFYFVCLNFMLYVSLL